MPVIRDSGGSDASVVAGIFGATAPPPPPPTAPPTLGSAPVVSATPNPGQGIATDAAGRISASVAAQAIAVFTADPVSPHIGQIWYRSDTSQLCVRHDDSTTKRVTLA